MEVATDAKLRQINFVRSEDLAGPADGVILRMVQIVDIVNVGADFWRKEL